ncbi:hypothetical protein [Actinophytocola sp.]|uniref:hypothetical protein n=1 Tax=Actinophytocola sp. TaxID=1872138 RepID=UPI002ED5A99F
MWWRRRTRTLSWTAPCRDESGRRTRLVVAPVGDGKVVLIVPRGGVAVLTMLAVGELRSALRNAALALADPTQNPDRQYEIEIHRATA